MPRRARKSNRQLAAGIVIAKQDIGHCLSRFLTEIPAFKDDRNVGNKVVNRNWPAIEKKNHYGLSGGDHRPYQLFLAADQIEAGAIAHMLQIPGFARSLLVITDGQDNEIRLFSDLHCFRNLPAIFFRIARHNLIDVPRAANRNLAAFAVEHLDARAGFGPDALEHSDLLFGHATVTTEQAAIGVWTNDGDGLDLV